MVKFLPSKRELWVRILPPLRFKKFGGERGRGGKRGVWGDNGGVWVRGKGGVV